MNKIIIITGNELRHKFFRISLANTTTIVVLKSYCEVPSKNLSQKVLEDKNNYFRREHLIKREQSEIDFFEVFCLKTVDASNPEFIDKGSVNSDEKVSEIIKYNPDLIIAYGCSIIQSVLIQKFEGRFVNIHLGLSPYYRGSGTNYFPFVNNQIECVGVTFMYINEGIDTGKIIHQIRPTAILGDTIHQIGNRLIKEMTAVATRLILNFEKLEIMLPINFCKQNEKYCTNDDFTEDSVTIMNTNFSNGIIKKYIINIEILNEKFPIIENPILL